MKMRYRFCQCFANMIATMEKTKTVAGVKPVTSTTLSANRIAVLSVERTM